MDESRSSAGLPDVQSEDAHTPDVLAPDMLRLFRSHVENCLKSIWEISEVRLDSDDDYPFGGLTSMGWVAVRSNPSLVQVFAHSAVGLRSSARLLRELNELNSQSTWCRIFLSGEVVLVAGQLPWQAVDQVTLGQLLAAVSGVADDIGPLLAMMFDGQCARPYDVASDEDAA